MKWLWGILVSMEGGECCGRGSRSERRRSVTLRVLIWAIDNLVNCMLGAIGWICLCLFIAIDLHEGVL